MFFLNVFPTVSRNNNVLSLNFFAARKCHFPRFNLRAPVLNANLARSPPHFCDRFVETDFILHGLGKRIGDSSDTCSITQYF